MKRMARDGIVTVIPRTKDVPYIYMPKPHIIRPDSPFINHYLGLVDTFIEIGKPRRFTIEPDVVPGKYRPDAYWMPDNADPVIIEYQRTRESVKDMQAKVDTFVKYHNVHKARTLWIKTAIPYTLRIADGFRLIVAEHLNNR